MDYKAAHDKIMDRTDISDFMKGYYIALLNTYKQFENEMYQRYDEKTVNLVKCWIRGGLYGSGVEEYL